MAHNTSNRLRSSIIYSIYVRNYGPTGTFLDVQNDLERIQALGTDIIWLLPIHPIGQLARKGSLGSPYAVSDYRAVNPEYGTVEDFQNLLATIHARGMRCIIDVVYNHTAPDSVLLHQHPEYFYRTPEGKLGNRAGAWSDVVDLDYRQPGLWEYQLETLEYWARMGVDGFRCDVASVVPLAFWQAARERVEKIQPDAVWLAESVHGDFLLAQRQNGHEAYSDCELYAAFDITYDYDIHPSFELCHAGAGAAAYLAELQRQEQVYPANYLKLRFLENHDQPRAAKIIPDEGKRNMWASFMYFIKGTALVYAGQESSDPNCPSLFERDPVSWVGRDCTSLLQKMAELRNTPVVQTGKYRISTPAGMPNVALVSYETEKEALLGIFDLDMRGGTASIPLQDGEYQNKITGKKILVSNDSIPLQGEPIVIELMSNET